MKTIDVYQNLLPNHQIIGINSNAIVGWDGVIHCITMQLFDDEHASFINEFSIKEKAFQIYPNPSYGSVWITLNTPANQTCQIELIDITGRCVFSTTRYFNSNTPEKFDLPELSKGIYLINVEGENTRGSQKIIVDTK